MGSSNSVPLVTVAILCYEQERTLYDSILSVCFQSYENIELLICDDGSASFDKKKVIEFIEKSKTNHIKAYFVYHNEINRGTVENCNAALLYANGAFLKLLAADDELYDQDVIRDLVAHFVQTQAQVVMGRGLAQGSMGRVMLLPTDMEYARIKAATPNQLYYLLCSRPWSSILAPAVAFKTSCLSQYNGFDQSYHYLEDWPLWIKLSQNGVAMSVIPRIIVKYSLSGISSTRKQSSQAYTARKKYLQECQALLLQEYSQLKAHCHTFLGLQCLLSERCIVQRERKLDRQFQARYKIAWSKLDGIAYIYQKIVGGIGNQRYLPVIPIVSLCILSLCCIWKGSFIMSCIFGVMSGGAAFWNLILKLLCFKFKVHKVILER